MEIVLYGHTKMETSLSVTFIDVYDHAHGFVRRNFPGDLGKEAWVDYFLYTIQPTIMNGGHGHGGIAFLFLDNRRGFGNRAPSKETHSS